MKKVFFILYLVLVIAFAVNMARQPKPTTPAPIRLVASESKYVLPKVPTISLINETDATITVDTCRDMVLTVNGVTRPNSLEGLCRVVEVPARTTTPLIGHLKEDVQSFQKELSSLSDDVELRFSYTSPDKTITETTLIVSEAGWIRLFFRVFFYNPVYNLFAALILLFPGHSLGFAIVAITIVIRLILLVPQQHMLVSQRRMQAIQPKIKAIQEAHKGDQATIGMKMMELYKKEGVNPLGSLLPIFIQIPILIVLYQVVLNISSPVNFAHLYGFNWLQHFQNIIPNPNFYGLHLEQHGGIVGIVLGVVTGGLQFIQMWLAQRKIKKSGTTVAPPTNPDMPDMQKMQQMMVYIFPIMAAWFAYQFPAGVGLYWLIGTIFMIAQQWVANRQAESKKIVIKDKAGQTIA